MIVPPYIDRPRDAVPDGLRYERLDHSYGDVRVPSGYGHGDDRSPAEPLGQHLRHDYTTGTTCDHRGRWDVLVAEAGERYDADDNLLPQEFRLVATCTVCGVVVPLEGELTPSAHSRGTHRLAVTPLRAVDTLGRELLAQAVNGYAGHGARWDVYRQREDGRGAYIVGVLEAGQTVRGRDYVIGRYGHPNSSRQEGAPLVEAPTVAGALRKLAKLEPPTTVPVSRYVPGTAPDYRGTWATDLVPDPTTAEAATARELELERATAQRRAAAITTQTTRAATVTPIR